MFGKYVKKLRKSAKMSMEEVSKRIGISSSYYFYIESGQRLPPSMASVEKMEEIFGVELKDMAREEREMSPISIMKKVKNKPILGILAYYADMLSDEEIMKLIREIKK